MGISESIAKLEAEHAIVKARAASARVPRIRDELRIYEHLLAERLQRAYTEEEEIAALLAYVMTHQRQRKQQPWLTKP